MAEDSSVKVAVRIRPQISKEVIAMCHVCTSVTPGEPQVWLGSDKAFTFDNVFDMSTQQETIYEMCIRNLIDGCLEGYNATVLAYGQTGSGKTYTMGTGFDISIGLSDVGIIPRAVDHLFQGIAEKQNDAREKGQPSPDFQVVAQFMELYNEEIIDLLDPVRESDDKNRKSHVKIHEDIHGGIYTNGLTSRNVTSADEALQCLKIGAVSRTTASTQMNVQSSRSHAIFTLHIKQQRMVNIGPYMEEMDGTGVLGELETLTAKFHFVDLAGSERLKRTGATGDRAKEGISINCGLLALGNVISALGDKSRRATHIPYRDSKLTRLLQDSLGGNSQTLMIACISPSDRDFMETLNTLKYANRAKNIKNKVSVNQDKSSQIIAVLRREIQVLQLELMEYKQGKRIVDDDGMEQVNDMFHENTMLLSENSNLRTRLKALQETLEHQTKRVAELLAEKTTRQWITSGDETSQLEITDIIKGYIKEVEDLRAKLVQSDEECSQLRKQYQKAQKRLSAGTSPFHNSFPSAEHGSSPTISLIAEAKQDVEKLRKRAKAMENAVEKISKEEQKQQLDDEKKNGMGDAEINGECENIYDLEDEDNESSDDSETEEKNAVENYSEDLADLTVDISMKQRLIEALEQSQQRFQTVRRHYEEKVMQLEQKIRETEMERDRVLANLSNNKENRSENVKKVKVEFEKKLSTLQVELKKMQVAKKEHAKLMRNQTQYEKQINQLKNDLTEMKRTKVKLMNKIKEESHRHKSAEQKIQREIAQLRKQGRVRENKIRSLETEKRLKDNVLRRKHEELVALRRTAKPMSDLVAGRVSANQQIFAMKKSVAYSPKVAKCHWQKLEKSINQLAISKQTVFNMEKDMDRFFKGREKLTKQLEILERKRVKAIVERKNDVVVQDYEDQIESLKANIDYYQENITECQTSIVQMEETKDDMDLLDVKNLVQQLSIDESKYLFEKLLNMVIHQTFQVVQKDSAIKEMEAKIEQTKTNNEFQVQLFELLVKDGNPEVLEFINSNADPVSESQYSSRSSSPVDSSVSEFSSTMNAGMESPKIRRVRKAGHPSDILSASHLGCLPPAGSCPTVADLPEKPHTSRLAWSFGPALQQELDSACAASNQNSTDSDRGIVRVTSAPTSLKEMGERPRTESSPLAKRKFYDKQLQDVSPAFRRKFYSYASVIPPSLSRQSSVETTASDITPPSSPTASRKVREDNVFSRLTSGSFRSNKPGRAHSSCIPTFDMRLQSAASELEILKTIIAELVPSIIPPWTDIGSDICLDLPVYPKDNAPDITYSQAFADLFSRGVIAPFVSKLNSVRNSPLICTHVAEGHSRAVLSIAATDDVLFSGSKDRTVKIWDLTTGQEIQSLGGHPNNVCAVRYSEYSRLAFSVSTAFIKVWDVRENPGKCIKTLCSSGASNPSTPIMNTPSRTLIMPNGETQIHDIALNRYGSTLFSAASNIVRMWDLRMFQSVGKLTGGHQAAIMCLAVDNKGLEKNIVVTGSKDHYIKVFEVMERSSGAHTPKMNLDPPHYDGIQSLAINEDFLFSGSRDSCIKKWNLRKRTHVQSLNQAHKDWVCALCFLPGNNSLISSGCRGGVLKLWAADTTHQLGEIKAHSAPINSIAANGSCLFTASNDCTVGMWRLRTSSDISPDYNDATEDKLFV